MFLLRPFFSAREVKSYREHHWTDGGRVASKNCKLCVFGDRTRWNIIWFCLFLVRLILGGHREPITPALFFLLCDLKLIWLLTSPGNSFMFIVCCPLPWSPISRCSQEMVSGDARRLMGVNWASEAFDPERACSVYFVDFEEYRDRFTVRVGWEWDWARVWEAWTLEDWEMVVKTYSGSSRSLIASLRDLNIEYISSIK